MNSIPICNIRKEKPGGLTLVELLVALAILTLVTALIVPRLRIINKERNLREAARIAGSAISSARDRAIRDGAAGVVIQRNINFSSTTSAPLNNQVFYAGTRLFEMRTLPEFTGDSDTDFAFVIQVDDADGLATLRCFIPAPLEHDPVNNQSLFERGDTIRLGSGRPLLIKAVLPVVTISFNFDGGPQVICGKDLSVLGNGPTLNMLPLDLAFDDNETQDSMANDPIDTTQADFVTNRQAPELTPVFGGVFGPYLVTDVVCIDQFRIERIRKRRSSVVDLPSGYLIDMRYSGPNDLAFMGGIDGDPETSTVFGLGLAPTVPPAVVAAPINSEVKILFDGKGSIDKVIFNGNTVLAGQSLYLFINEFEPSVVGDTTTVAQTLLSNPSSLWLTVGFNGGINIGYNAPPAFDTVPNMIANARGISRSRNSANQ